MDPATHLEACFRDLYERCLPPDEATRDRWHKMPKWRPKFHMVVADDEATWALAKGIRTLSSFPFEEARLILFGAAYKCFESSEPKFDLFVRNATASAIAFKKRKVVPHKLWATFEARLTDSLGPRFVVDRTNIDLKSVDDFERETAQIALNDTEKWLRSEFSASRSIVALTIEAVSPDDAVEKADRVISVLRGILTWSYYSAFKEVIFVGNPAGRHSPPWLYLISGAPGSVRTRGRHHVHERGSRVEDAQLDALAILHKCLEPSHQPGSTRRLLADALQIATNGLDAPHPAHQFLAVWTGLERLCLVDGGSSQEVVRRASHLLDSTQHSRIAVTLSHLAATRNRLVHSGEFDESDNVCSSELRTIFGRAALRIAVVTKDLPTERALKEYFRVRATTKRELRESSAAIRFRLSEIRRV